MEKPNLLVTFSGGETSAFMAQWLFKHKNNEYNMVFVFANTGQESEPTLEFINNCENEFGFKINWIECVVNKEKGKGTRHKIIDFKSASRNGEPFEDVIKKYGLPTTNFLHCTRELKLSPVKSFAKEYFNGQKYLLALGIRSDEFDRMNPNYKKLGIIYPLIQKDFIPVTKKHINFYWKQMPFRLNLKGYQGNCITCYKKSDKKLFQIAKETPSAFDFFKRMELLYSKGYSIFRGSRNVEDILRQSKEYNGKVNNDNEDSNIQLDLLNDSCEIFTECK
jgi:hypothetical protein